MISVYIGRPGAGKSYSACVRIIAALQAGRCVYTNLPVDVDAFVSYLSRGRPARWGSLSRRLRVACFLFRRGGSNAPRFARRVNLRPVDDAVLESPDGWARMLREGASSGGSVIVVDEAGARFDALAALKGAELDKFRRSMQEHRHYYASILLCAQSHHQIDSVGRRVKALVEQWCEITNLRYALGVSGYVRSVYAVHYGEDRVPISVFRGRYRGEIFSLYRSHALGGDAVVESGMEVDVSAGGSTARGKLIFVCCIVLGGLIALGFIVPGAVDRAGSLAGGDRVVAPVGAAVAPVDGVEIEGGVDAAVDPLPLPAVLWRRVAASVGEGRYLRGGQVIEVSEGCTLALDARGFSWLGCPR